MKVHLTSVNSALGSVFENPSQLITLDANILIPPHRSGITRLGFDFPMFQRIWLDPIFSVFPNLAIHEAVYDELVMPSIRSYIQEKADANPPQLIIHKDSSLGRVERLLRDSIEEKIYPLTKYDPLLDNKDDRGEVKSLAYIAVKGLLYFAAHDDTAIQLIEKAQSWETGLDNVHAIKMYELIFYLHAMGIGEKRSLRMLYKYQYHLTKHEKNTNPGWNQFLKAMQELYQSHLSFTVIK